MAFNGNNIKFLQGSYDKLKTLTTSEVGAFYITNDTHEMFLGVEANKAPVALNRWVDVQADWAAVQAVSDYKQHPGKIYYAKAENILCTWNGEKWVQINPDTDTDTILKSVDIILETAHCFLVDPGNCQMELAIKILISFLICTSLHISLST
jgi:hypothetical protein